MGAATRNLFGLVGMAAALAAALPVQAGEGQPPPAAESCRVPGVPGPDDATAAERRRADLAAAWSRLAAENAQARAEGVQPLNGRGYNYQQGRWAPEPAALDFEARDR